ncbi:hypothetical protein B0H17DRAFT_1094205 [Mycena rosella]|uniref:CUE domain-containing protein n=1 Tax=Mycena rosella TaxID=1033263 RepID=A0AAD7G379_MYCRO|nr:hypothetical protein B0H17DRAFT_1094205 [Mycena rosella]
MAATEDTLVKPDAEVIVPEAAKPIDSAAADETVPAAAAASPPIASPIESPAAAPPAASTEPTPTPTPATDSEPAPPPREREMVQDPRLAVLRAMFPDFDDSLLQSVLDSVNGNTDNAIDALLGMSDPDYTSEQAAAPQAPQTQEELDEQLARTLMLEDEREEHAWRAQQQQPPPQQRPQAQRLASDGAPERDTMQEFQEQFNKFAENGKKTLGTLFSKVKAKIQEFDQPVGQASSGGDAYPYEAQQNPYPATRTPQQQQQQQQAQAQMPAYYDPNAPSSNPSPPASATGYDAAPRSMSPPVGTGATASPPSTNTGAPQIDGGKLGMLPKRPVSLLRTNSPPVAPHPSSDEDELEYAENPFEEGKK